jgi:hypothetical protein
MKSEHHQVQLNIDGIWRTFFILGCGLNENCRIYRQMRDAFRKAELPYQCQLLRVLGDSADLAVDMVENQTIYEDVWEVIDNFCKD